MIAYKDIEEEEKEEESKRISVDFLGPQARTR